MTTLRDFTHASKIFRSGNYQKTPKAKFLFHVVFNINQPALPAGLTPNQNFGVYVRNIKLPSYSFNTLQLNQYNRKRIVQTKIKYDPVNITFHDDNASIITQLWNSYYIYYYRDGSKPQVVFNGAKGGRPTSPSPGFNPLYNNRTQYINTVEGDYDWGFIGEPSNLNQLGNNEPVKVPFFKDITVFSFYQHNWTAYTLINPLITNFQHDTHDYDQGNGVMTNQMTLDYETVVYNYGILDGNDPSNIIRGFGTQDVYDRRPSPNTQNIGSLSNVLTATGILNARQGALVGAIYDAASSIVNAAQNIPGNGLPIGTNGISAQGLQQQGSELFTQFPSGSPLTSPIRNTMFLFPVAGITPGTLGTASAPVVGGIEQPQNIGGDTITGKQVTSLKNLNPDS